MSNSRQVHCHTSPAQSLIQAQIGPARGVISASHSHHFIADPPRLLETGSSQLIRNTAAQQLADVQKNHPDELFNLLLRVVPYLRSKSWDTRVAAAKAIGGIVDHAPAFVTNTEEEKLETNVKVKGEVKDEKPIKSEKDGEHDGTSSAPLDHVEQLSLDTLDVESVLVNGKELLASAGRQYDLRLAGLTPAERLTHQKKSLTARLGLGGEYIEEPLLDDADMASSAADKSKTMSDHSASALDLANRDRAQQPQDEAMNKRQLNMLKRRRKEELKRDNKKFRYDFEKKAEPDIPPKAEQDADFLSLERKGSDDETKLTKDFKGAPAIDKSQLVTEAEEAGDDWPFERLCEFLTVDLFDPAWEIRHGAAMALREIIRSQGADAGRMLGKSFAQNNTLNKSWLDDLACRICCVFMLDRFADYLSDNAVAPIRETVGQTLAALLKYLPDSSVLALNRVLYRLVMQSDFKATKRIWHACHGGMMGMRYMVAVRSDLILKDAAFMTDILDCVMKGLQDSDDDVRSVSAATLIPVAQEIVTSRPSALSNLIKIVWDCLDDLSDDLSASTGSVMDLLARLCSFPAVLDAMRENAAGDATQTFAELVPRLFPFLRHTIQSVRIAVLRALLAFLDIDDVDTRSWVSGIALRLVYQNLLVERHEPVLRLSHTVWQGLVKALDDRGALVAEFETHLPPLIQLTLHPIGVSRHFLPMEPTLFMRPSGQTYQPFNIGITHKRSPKLNGGEFARKSKKPIKENTPTPTSTSHNIDAHVMQGDVDVVGLDVLIRSKTYAARALGILMAAWSMESRVKSFSQPILEGLASPFSSSRTTAAIVAQEFASAFGQADDLSNLLAARLRIIVEDERPAHYSDLTSSLQVVRSQCQNLLNTFREKANVLPQRLPTIAVLVQGETDAGKSAFSTADGENIADKEYDRIRQSLSAAQRLTAGDLLTTAKLDLNAAISEANTLRRQREERIVAAAAAALVTSAQLPKKPQAVIKALMDSVKGEENSELQARSADAVVTLIDRLCADNRVKIVDKVVGNLVKFYCMDTSETPEFGPNAHIDDGILSLQKDEDIQDRPDIAKYEQDLRSARITRRGAKRALERLCLHFGDSLLSKVPMLRTLIHEPITTCFDGALPAEIKNLECPTGQSAVDALSILRAILPSFATGLHAFVRDLMPHIIKSLSSDLAVLRYAGAKCFATVCSTLSVDGFTMLVEKVLPSIGNSNDLHARQGIIECIYHLIHVMEDGILPYVIFLLVPVLGRMSDSDHGVRLIATTAFATLVKLVPLEAGIPDPPGLSDTLLQGRDRERKFIAQMLDPKKVEPFAIPVAIKAELRSYQQDGVNWLAFLNRYNLHGVLCDDMGLGKTLQTLCIVASDHHMRAEEFAKTQDENMRRTPSIIVCPPTLSGHWQQEIRTYAPFLTPVAYVGPPAERNKVRSQLATADVVITSYDICRNDADVLTKLNWNYCVLDEGHLIKNPRAMTSVAVKRLVSNHRLILSGTPIQNNVLELWSLFDFLMPGFLGTEKMFRDRFAKPIATSRYGKSSSKEQEAGALAIEALHKQVLPFLLRRLKEEVLNDLPPKIIQNYYCDLSDLQKKLFQDFTQKEGKKLQEEAGSGDKEAKQHIFQALQYMRKLCNSPALVMKQGHKQYEATQQYLATKKTSLQDPSHAPKLLALRDLLVDCGIGVEESANNNGDTVPTADQAVSPHRALIFCQMREMLDMVESTVLKKLLPSVTFSRLDGSVEASKRQDIVNKFNSDPSIDCLLLTTSVGGLGLNLTGADTVIFVEHDWNPQKDMQAMDRAHRIGQKKVVNVYRLVTRGTLEEKILK